MSESRVLAQASGTGRLVWHVWAAFLSSILRTRFLKGVVVDPLVRCAAGVFETVTMIYAPEDAVHAHDSILSI